MKYAHTLGGGSGEPLIRDIPVYDATSISSGEALTYGATVRGAVLISSAALGADFVGVAQETITASTTVLTTGTLVFAKVLLGANVVFDADYDMAAANDIDVSSSTSTATTLGTTDDDMDGGWIYINSGTGIGQLGYIGEATTTVMTLDTTTAWTTTPDATSDCLIIRHPWRHAAGGGKDLDGTFILLLSDEDETGEILVLENYIRATTLSKTPLRPRSHHMLQNLNSKQVVFSSDIYFTDNIFNGATTMA